MPLKGCRARRWREHCPLDDMHRAWPARDRCRETSPAQTRVRIDRVGNSHRSVRLSGVELATSRIRAACASGRVTAAERDALLPGSVFGSGNMIGRPGQVCVAAREKPTVHTDRPSGRTPSAIYPRGTPRHSGPQRYKVTHDGTEKKRPA